MSPEKLEEIKIHLSKVDVSSLPFNMQLSLVDRKSIPEVLMPPEITDYAIHLLCLAPDIENKNQVLLSTYSSLPDRFIADDASLDAALINLIMTFLWHEVRESFLVDGFRKYDPHKNNYPIFSSWS